MEILFNDLSLHGQFSDIPSFKVSFNRVMDMRRIVRRYGREIHCHRNMVNQKVTNALSMPQAIQSFRVDERRSIMQWLTRQGPFWEDTLIHSSDDYLECRGKVVTETAVGEAGFRCLHGSDQRLVSFSPSSWEFSPIPVSWFRDELVKTTADVVNYWQQTTLEADLRSAPLPLHSWGNLAKISQARFTNLTFSTDGFEPLKGYPFVNGAAQRIIELLNILNRFKICFDENGQRTKEGHQIHQDFFTGKKGNGGRGALFTDSSDNEKRKFKKEMTFKHPMDPNRSLFCPMHGKVQTPQIRIHFSCPVQDNEPLYIVYIGPKITM